jgi:hypothetical protein
MNNQIAMMNEAFRRQTIDLEAMARTQRNNKRTVIDMDRLDTARALELTRMISHDDEDLGQIITPIPFSEIEHDTEATLNVVMQALGLYTFPTVELTGEYEQANNMIDFASRAKRPCNGGLINVDTSVKDFITWLKNQLNIKEK